MSLSKNNSNLRTVDGQIYEVPEMGSLGLLALGYSGIMLWREKRQKAKINRLNKKNAE